MFQWIIMCEILCSDTIKDIIMTKLANKMLSGNTVLSTIQNNLLHEFIDKKFVSFCNRFPLCFAATAGH